MTEDTIDATLSRIASTVQKHQVEDVLVRFAEDESALRLPQTERFHHRLTAQLEVSSRRHT